ncbi:uncharacterized protein LOC129309835 [Prosopis cineraria]|uniref:uncharacterized protein LOC129309835 n=1 Tax=Prosopis cineraria TaxID=364024 RepID=UPI00240F73FE|nr:uncharacterized protein LOC129309835 [Prosopis cineraria]XP_054807556.1 uncharacterized protein LOC129309835 [Prosopis cineraria]XP_054807564.1 uncharacterized protein LOC129309835 [Prosopis cineraria]XP_054807573.1 uncharacterized protein LOC129309835 [Prosopis cineraria]
MAYPKIFLDLLINGSHYQQTLEADHIYGYDLYSFIGKTELSQSFKQNDWNHMEIFIKNNTSKVEIDGKICLGANVCKQEKKFDNIRFLTPGSRHDVFLSFQGYASRSFTDKLYNALYESKINAFKDVESFGWGEDICPTVVRAIEESRISIIVFSSYYAESKAFLDTVAMIMDCMKTKGKLAFPIFYNVDSSEVRHKSRHLSLGRAGRNGNTLKNVMEKLQGWKLALFEAARMPSWSLEEGYKEEYVIPRIIEVVSRHLLSEHLTKSIKSIGNTMGHQGPRLDVLILSCQEAFSDSNIFVDNLYNALYESNINAFKDDGSSGWRKDLGPIAQDIEESRISIIVFSESYAYSVCCLDALAMIIDCIKTKGKLVFPIFYNVDASTVRQQTESFESAMHEHENRLKDNTEKVEKWKLALYGAAHMLGWSLEKGEEIDVIPRIVEEVACHLRFEHLTKSEESTDDIIMRYPEQQQDMEELEDDPCRDSSSMKSIELTESIVSQQGEQPHHGKGISKYGQLQGKNKGKFHKNGFKKGITSWFGIKSWMEKKKNTDVLYETQAKPNQHDERRVQAGK